MWNQLFVAPAATKSRLVPQKLIFSLAFAMSVTHFTPANKNSLIQLGAWTNSSNEWQKLKQHEKPPRKPLERNLKRQFIRLISITVAAGMMAMPIMRVVGKGMLKLHAAIPLQQMVMGVILFVSALVWFTTGFIGIGVLIIGTIIGLIPPRVGIRRSHGMGIIIVPIMIYTYSQAQDAFGFL